ncbi:hypothetical protein QE439_004378 [Pedobacter agri]|nr:hypothetical protein [Pedobacter agri]
MHFKYEHAIEMIVACSYLVVPQSNVEVFYES